MASNINLDLQAVIDGLGQGIIIFDDEGKLIRDNLAARTLLGKDLNLIRSNGWEAATALFNSRQRNPDDLIEVVRDRALQSERPVRFHTYLGGEYVPCWAAAVQGEDGKICLMMTLDIVDWSAVGKLLNTFRTEMKDAIDSTQGHIDIIHKTIASHKPDDKVQTLARRITGFTQLISIHMHRVGRLMELMERLENVRTGKIREIVRDRRHKIVLSNYLEDFIEELDEIMLVDPETEARDHRSRISITAPEGIAVDTSPHYLTLILRDVLRNAIMYSMKASPINIKVSSKNETVQIDVIDEGYGIRESENERVFGAFERARQPQIIAEFGYGLGLYISQHEVEAMNGRMWFQSQEKVGTTFSFTLPTWREETVSSPSSSSQTKSEES